MLPGAIESSDNIISGGINTGQNTISGLIISDSNIFIGNIQTRDSDLLSTFLGIIKPLIDSIGSIATTTQEKLS